MTGDVRICIDTENMKTAPAAGEGTVRDLVRVVFCASTVAP